MWNKSQVPANRFDFRMRFFFGFGSIKVPDFRYLQKRKSASEFHGYNFSTKPEPNPNPTSTTQTKFKIKLNYYLVYLHSWFLVIATQMLKISQILFNQTIEESNFSSDMQIPYMRFVFRITYNHSCKYQMWFILYESYLMNSNRYDGNNHRTKTCNVQHKLFLNFSFIIFIIVLKKYRYFIRKLWVWITRHWVLHWTQRA